MIQIKNQRNGRLYLIMQEKGMNQSQLSDALGVTFQHINSILYNRYNPNAEFKIKIAKALGVDSRIIFPCKEEGKW